jgi:hypothetical protein
MPTTTLLLLLPDSGSTVMPPPRHTRPEAVVDQPGEPPAWPKNLMVAPQLEGVERLAADERDDLAKRPLCLFRIRSELVAMSASERGSLNRTKEQVLGIHRTL